MNMGKDAALWVRQPWLSLIHGVEDDVVPVSDGRDAFAAATCVKEWLEIPGAGHSFGPELYPIVMDAMNRWLATRLPSVG